MPPRQAQHRDEKRGPWNREPKFRYVADPQPRGGLAAAPVNPDDEKTQPLAA